MKFFRTPAQKRILRFFWKNQQPFSTQDLIGAGITRYGRTTAHTLRSMEKAGQIYSLGQGLYCGTTDSQEEWAWLRQQNKTSPAFLIVESGPELNRIEREKLCLAIAEMIEKKREGLR